MVALFHSSADRVSAPELRSVRAHLALAFVSMLLLGLAFPSPGWSFLAHVALVPITLLAVWAHHSKRFFWSTYLASYLWWLVMLGWLIGVTGGGYAALAAYMALYIPVYLLLFRLVDRRFALPAALTVPMIWVSLEYIRGTFLQGGMAWFGLGHTQAPYLPGQSVSWIIQVADLAGDWTVSFVVAASNGFIIDIVRAVLNRRARLTALMPSAILWLLLFGGAMVYGAAAVRVEPRAGSVRVAIIQTNISQDNKQRPTAESQTGDWNRLLELTKQALATTPKPRIIVWPETIVPVPLNPEVTRFYLRERQAGKAVPELRFHEQISELASEHQVDFFVGSGAILFDPFRRYNSVFHYQANGQQAEAYYSKIDRVPFGEYIPWVEDWPWLKELFLKYLSPYGPGNDYTLTPGDYRTVFTIPRKVGETPQVLRVTAPICFEDAFARSCLALVYDRSGKRSDIMLNLTNDGWYPSTDQGFQHYQMAVLRCVETRAPMARSVNTGVSGFIDSNGRVGPFVVGPAGQLQEIDGIAVADMLIDQRSSLFGRVGTMPVTVLMVITALLCGWAFATRK